MRTITAILLLFASSASTPCWSAALRDPTRPYQYDIAPTAVVQEKGKEEWHLSGVQIRNGSKSAILNGKLVREGDRIGAASVVRIEPWQVTLAEDYREVVIKLLAASVKEKTGDTEKNE